MPPPGDLQSSPQITGVAGQFGKPIPRLSQCRNVCKTLQHESGIEHAT
jgi:hypothetical protein